MTTTDLTKVSDLSLLDDLRHEPSNVAVLNEIARRFQKMVMNEDAVLQPFALRHLHKFQKGKVGRIFDNAALGICNAIGARGPNKKGEGPAYQLTLKMKLKGWFEFDEDAKANYLAGIEVSDASVTTKVPPATIEPVLMIKNSDGQIVFNTDSDTPRQPRLPNA